MFYFTLLCVLFLLIIHFHKIVRMLTAFEATVVTFICGKVRIVQATCNPSEKYPTLNLTLRAIYNLGAENYDQKVAFDILKWILSPPEPARELAVRGKK